MYEVSITKSFSAAHMLPAIGGKCEELHGHNFKVEVTVAAKELNTEGILIDFRLIKRWLQEIIAVMDHKHLNETPFFAGGNPSSENIARHICREMELKVTGTGVRVARVRVWESENAFVSYIPD